MSGGFPILPGFADANDIGTVAANSAGTQSTNNATAHTKGSYVQLVASTPKDAVGALVTLHYGAGQNIAVDIAVGAAGSEIPIIQNLVGIGNDSNTISLNHSYFFPIQIPAGTRIAARSQGVSGGTVRVMVTLFDGDLNGEGGSNIVDTYGFVSGSTSGAVVDPGGTAHTKGAYTQLTASTTADLSGFLLGFDATSLGASSGSYMFSLLDIAIGPAGQERVILPNLPVNILKWTAGSLVTVSPHVTPFFPIPIPAGMRIAARSQCAQTTASSRAINLTLYGVRA